MMSIIVDTIHALTGRVGALRESEAKALYELAETRKDNARLQKELGAAYGRLKEQEEAQELENARIVESLKKMSLLLDDRGAGKGTPSNPATTAAAGKGKGK